MTKTYSNFDKGAGISAFQKIRFNWENRKSIDYLEVKNKRKVLSLKETKIFGELSEEAFFICDFSYEKFRFSFFNKLAKERSFGTWSPRAITLCQADFDVILQSMT